MNCNQIKDIIARYFDEDRLTELSGKYTSHIDKCPNCRAYLKSLQILDNDIRSLVHHSLLYEEKNELLKSIEASVKQRIKVNTKKIPLYIQRIAAIAAIFLIAMVFFISKLINNADQDEILKEAEKFQLYSAEIEKQPASTIIYQPMKPNKPLIVWLYVTKGDE